MKIFTRKIITTLILTVIFTATNAAVCNDISGGVNCKSGTVNSLSGNGMVTVNGTTISGRAYVNGLLKAKDSSFLTLEVNGGVLLTNCTIDGQSTISGTLIASSSKFEKDLKIYASEVRFNNSKALKGLHFGHTDSKKQVVYLDKFSQIAGDVIFDDGNGEVILSHESTIQGKVVGGHTTVK